MRLNADQLRRRDSKPFPVDIGNGDTVMAKRPDMRLLVLTGALPTPLLNSMMAMMAKYIGQSLESLTEEEVREQVPDLLREIRESGLAFEGFHLFAGSQNLKAESICEAQEKSFELALRLAEDAPAPICSLNLGGGFGIPYFPGELPLDLAPIGDNLGRLVERAKSALPDADLVIELGRYLVGEAGVYVSRIVDRKSSRGRTYLVTDGGLNHHLSASGNFGQVLRKNYPVAIGNRMQSPSLETVSVVGPLCTPLDLLADQMGLSSAAAGDLFVLYQSGAYGASASPQAFLGHDPVTEVLVG